jgi:hypothetical protein
VNEGVHVVAKGQTCRRFPARSVASPSGQRLQ